MKDAITYANEAGFFSFNVVGWKAEFERLIEAVRADALAELVTVKESLTAQDHSAGTGNKVSDHIADAGTLMLTTEQAQQIEEALESVHGLSGINMSKPLATIRAARAQEQAEQEPMMDYERINALREGEQNGAEDAYFFVRPENDTPSLRKMFCQGFERGFHKGLKYASHVRTKDLTDDEIKAIALPMIPDEECSSEDQANFLAIEVIRAVIAADREKNRG